MILLRQTRSTRRTRSIVAPRLSLLPRLSIIAALLFAAPVAHAQVSFGGIEASIGRGSGKGGEFWDRTRIASRFGTALGLRVRPSLDVVLGADYEIFDHFGDYIDICESDGKGGCLQLYPQLAGSSGTVGLRWVPDPGFHLTTRVGGGRYHTTDDAVSRRPRDVSRALVLREDAAWRVVGPFWFVASASHVRFADVRGDPLHITAITVGARLR